MPTDVYLSFIAYACAATWLPGPNNILLLAAAGQAGLKRCRPLLLGIWTGIITVMFLAAGFCSALEKAVPRIAPLFRYAGCAYILYLAWKTLVRKPADAADADASRPLLFRDGFLLQFMNMKIIMLGLAAYPGYFLPYPGGIGKVFLFVFTMTACCGTGNLIWGIAGSILQRFYDAHYRTVNVIMALLLAWCALRIALG